MPAVAVDHHLDAADFRYDVWAPRQFRNRSFPVTEYLIAPSRIRSNTNGTSKVIEHDRGVGKHICQIGQFSDLRVVDPAFKR